MNASQNATEALATALLDCEATLRMNAYLPTEHVRSPSEMLFPLTARVRPEVLLAFDNAKMNPNHAGMVAFIHEKYQEADRLWRLIHEKTLPSKHVLYNVNFDPEFHKGLDFGPISTAFLTQVSIERLGPSNTKTVFIACDGKYFEDYASALIESIKATSDLPIHLHVMDPSLSILSSAHSVKTAGLSFEYPQADRGYYHSMRFVRFRELLPHYGKLLLLDADQLANKDLSPLFTDLPTAMRMRPGRIEPWNQINASAVFGDGSEESLTYFGKVAAYLIAYRNALFWGIDQLALYAIWVMHEQPGVHCYDPIELDYKYTPDGILWPNSGAGKFTGSKERPAFANVFFKYQAKTNTPEGHALRGKEALIEGRTEEAKDAYLASFAQTTARLVLKHPPFEDHPRNKTIGKFIYLPVENSARELKSKAWLAGELARRGFQVALGAIWSMIGQQFEDLPPGIVLFKTMNAFDAVNCMMAKRAGHVTAVLNEEFLGLPNDLWIYEAQIHPYCANNFDIVCAQNAEQALIYRDIFKSDVYVTGNPRLRDMESLYNPDSTETLICTSAGLTNNITPFHHYIEASYKSFGSINEHTKRLMKEQIEHEITLFPQMMDTIHWYAKHRGTKTRVRPHPSEDPSLYQSIEGITLDDRTALQDRLRDAEMLIGASGCTTLLEAKLANVPTHRIGSGGHGVSRRDELPRFPECVLPDVLAGTPVGKRAISLEKVMKNRNGEFRPHPFHENKFPPVSPAAISEMAGHAKVTEVGWRMFTVSA